MAAVEVSRRALLIGIAASTAPSIPLERRPFEVALKGVTPTAAGHFDVSEVVVRIFDGTKWWESAGVSADELRIEFPPKKEG